MSELIVDRKRLNIGKTGIFVRAKLDDKWGNYDICDLDKSSLLEWLKSSRGDNQLAENVVGILLGHGHLHKFDDGLE